LPRLGDYDKGAAVGRVGGLRKRDGEPLPPAVFDGDGSKALPLLRKRARAGFIARLNILERIADGDFEQAVTQESHDGKKTRTRYTPSAKDRMQALRMLAEYGHVPTSEEVHKGAGGHGDPAALTRALLGALADPVVRRALAADPDVGPAIRLLTAQEVPGTAIELPGEDELNAVMAQEIVIEGDETAPETAQET